MPEVRVATAAVGAAHEELEAVERAPTQHAVAACSDNEMEQDIEAGKPDLVIVQCPARLVP